MNIERELIISVLKLTKNGLISAEVVSRDAKIPFEVTKNLLKRLQSDGLLYLQDHVIEANGLKHLRLAVRAIEFGADPERVSGFLDWREFENIAAVAFERNGYSVKKNLRFMHAGRRWEIDIIACRRPVVVCVDCKHWHHGMYPSAIRSVVEEQVERTCAFAESLPKLTEKIDFTSWSRVKLVPAILSLVTARSKFFDNVPVVSVLQLQDFINQLPAYANTLKHFSKCLTD